MNCPDPSVAPARITWFDFGQDQEFSRLLATQRDLRARLLEGRRERVFLLTCSHRPTLSFGYRQGFEAGLRCSPDKVDEGQIAMVRSERGGEATYHGPGQAMLYPILHLPSWKLSVRAYIAFLERVLSSTALQLGLKNLIQGSSRPDLGAGLWVEHQERIAKIASVGIHIRQGVCIQGACLNVSGDLSPFSYIYPCGKEVIHLTNVSEVLGGEVAIQEVSRGLVRNFRHHLNGQLSSVFG